MSIATTTPDTIHPELLELGQTQPKTNKAAKTIGIVTIVVGLLMSVVGVFTWNSVSQELASQNITVSSDAQWMAGEPVDGPLAAYSQAQIIAEHSLNSTDGKTYAEMDKTDPARESAMNASFLQASLYTSVIAFGVAALVTGLGALFMLVGAGIVTLAKKRN